MAMRQERRPPPPLDPAALERLALRYVERFATTRGKLADYLGRKIRERGWDGDLADPRALAQKMADLGYVDDRLFAESKAAALGRRGLSAPLAPAIQERAGEAALTYARRKRIGPFGPPTDDRKVRDRQLAAMLRAGHGFEIARRIVLAHNEEDVGELD
jgi:regulatory protein